MGRREYRLRFWGVRGTVATPAPDKLRYGGNTICAAAELSDDEYLLLDCGTGVRLFGAEIAKKRQGLSTKFHLFLSHYHFDHVEGLPYFPPLYDSRNSVFLYGFAPSGQPLRSALETLIAPPYFPVLLAGAPASVTFVDATQLGPEGVAIRDVRVRSCPLNHPDGSLSYRLDHDGRSVVYATDHEHGNEATDRALSRFAENADYLIYDATYLPAEYDALRRGWGHSTWYAAVAAARAACARKLILFHHHPEHTDSDLDRVLEIARRAFPSTEMAAEGMELEF